MRAFESHLCAATLVAATAFASPGAAQESGTFDLEQVLSAPFPSDLVATPTGDAVAWVFNARGVRNIWIARAPDYRARQLTTYENDDGQPITDLAWTPDGNSIVFVRGGAPNRQGELPNPWSRPDGVSRQIMIVDTADGDPRALAEGAAPLPTPAGDAVIFLSGGDIWSVPLDGGDPESLVALRGGGSSLAWSPDGSRLAFVSRRGDHAFVGVYDAEDQSVRWMDPGVDRDGSPVWSPDGRRIAFIRIPARRRSIPFTPEREAEPWSIRVADPATGRGREVWRAEPGVGSAFRGVVAANQLAWTADDRIVFPWERDGWTHLYSVAARGGDGTATLLTPGAFEVEYVTLNADRRHVIYNSNQDDIDRRHLWRVAAVGGPPTPLTRGDGIEWSPVPLTEGATLALLRSDARRPARPAILKDGSIRDLAASAIPADFPSEHLVAPKPVVFTAADGLRIHGQLFLPPESEGRHPAVIFFHGGSRRQMLLGWHYRGYYHNAYALNQYLASRGYVVLSVNYRSGVGYGMEFREALNYGAGGASEFNDVLGAGLYLRDRPDVNPAAIGLWGGSYGGYLTALGLARASDLFAAGVDLHGVHDWNVVIQNFYSSYDTLRYPAAARTAFESSPMADIDTWTSPVLLIHGDDDRNVPFSETVDLAAALRAHDVAFEQLVFPDEVHGFLTHARWHAAYRAAADFFERYLKR
ncbi:MAG: S9 family peptidase [Gemmatimonadetes bacterium]|uniref:Acyl-peptide hydrolase n=1 Tax=Candidatus Kutchimonas denitrificans TaxID=3056748 RepID=A0AAE5C863_9BACT|nr:S9 family peptidase [Gemmatimonadota bacterium]NIR74206.1 S9 family peptidase [Candidatus Kutchimonas denitrificans]NIR99828.1 S9 family peptidase [Gemmatimonadota bacterium]NIT65417.1 S9 family peptidase [Gemmatimonadota bacterium]NIU51782.1 prolyl oligopeptidase family serine peptidase [Gemmatimonadota bacterium]